MPFFAKAVKLPAELYLQISFLPIDQCWHSFRNHVNMKRVLIVDDEIDLCLMIKLFLTKKNYEVHTAHTLSEGFQKMDTVHPDALLLDNNLPDGMGWKFAENIHEKYPKMHITLISAYHAAKDFRSRFGDAINVLEKPISLKDIERYL